MSQRHMQNADGRATAGGAFARQVVETDGAVPDQSSVQFRSLMALSVLTVSTMQAPGNNASHGSVDIAACA